MRRQFWRPFRVAVKQRRYHSQPERSEQDENGYAAMSFVPVRAGRKGSCPCDVPAGFNIPCLGRGDWPNARSCFFCVSAGGPTHRRLWCDSSGGRLI